MPRPDPKQSSHMPNTLRIRTNVCPTREPNPRRMTPSGHLYYSAILAYSRSIECLFIVVKNPSIATKLRL